MSSFFCAEHLARQANTSPPYSEGGVFFQIDTISPNGYNIRKSVLQSEWVVFSIIHIHSCGTNRTWKKAFSVKLKKVKKASGYDVIYAMNKSMSARKTKTVKGAKRVKIKVKGLKPKKKYIVTSMPYKMYKGHKYIGILCKTKKVKTR